MKSGRVLRIGAGVVVLAVAWMGFQLATHRHTGVLKAFTAAKHFVMQAPQPLSSQRSDVQEKRSSASAPQHSVSLSWKASTSAVAGYNVYRRDESGVTKINVRPIPDTTYVDNAVQPGKIYYYVAKAVTSTGRESGPSNEVQAVIPSP